MNKNKKHFSKTIFFALLLIVLITSGVQISAQSITIYWDEVRQEIDGFGASAAFRQADNLKKFPASTRNEILDLLFSTTEGIGLSMVRNMVGDGSMSEWGNDIDGPVETIEPQRGVWNFDAVDEQIWFMKEAEARGVTRHFSTVWSPPRWMKDNNSCINGGSVRSDMYGEYAEYLYQYVTEYLKNRNGIDLYAISVANEPDMTTGYSSTRWTGEQFQTFVRDYLGPKFREENQIDTKIMIGEDSNWTEHPAVATLNDSRAVGYVDIVGGHNYGTSNYPPFNTARSKGKKVWETEVSNLGNNDRTMNDGMKWARQIHDFFTNAQGNAWCYWWAICYKVNPDKGEALININTSNNTYFTNKRLYTMGNYSRFVRPGWYRLNASTSSSNNVFITAFKDPETEAMAIVAINSNNSQQNRSFNLSGADIDSVTPYYTSSTDDLRQGNDISVSNGSFSATLPAYSVTTFYKEGNSAPRNLGDVNRDEQVNIVDALLIAQYYVNLDPDNFDETLADTNCDYRIDIVDALLIAQFYVNLIDGFCLD